MGKLDELYNEGMLTIRGEHAKTQLEFLDAIGSTRGLPGDYLAELGAFFVPNDEYMAAVFGERIRDLEFGCYSEERCLWAGYLVFPIYNVVDAVCGFVGFNPSLYLEKKEDATVVGNHYMLSGKSTMAKGSFLFGKKGTLHDAYRDGYVLVVDGLFDAVSLSCEGFNAVALLGSALTDVMVMQLRFTNKVIVLADNDLAGLKLYEKLRSKLHSVILYKQPYGKDVDELLHSERHDGITNQLRALVGSSCHSQSVVAFK